MPNPEPKHSELPCILSCQKLFQNQALGPQFPFLSGGISEDIQKTMQDNPGWFLF
jgi:hypothetical protein